MCTILLANMFHLAIFAMSDDALQAQAPYVNDYTSSSTAIEPNDVADVTIDVIDPNLTKELRASNRTITMQEDSNFQNDSSDNTFLESTISYDDRKSGTECHFVLNNFTYVGEGHKIKDTYQFGSYQNSISVDVIETMHTADLEDTPSYQLQNGAYMQTYTRIKDV